MKIRIQSIILLFIGLVGITLTGYLTLYQLNRSYKITLEMRRHQDALVTLNDFQKAASDQILYGVDLIRTGDITGNRIVLYRMTETLFLREITNLDSLLGIQKDMDLLVVAIKRKGEKVAKMCKEEMMDPLYAHKPLKEGIIEKLIYQSLENLSNDANQLRNNLDNSIRDVLYRQEQQRKQFLSLYLPLAGGILFTLYLILYQLIHRSINSINKTKGLLEKLASGKSRLDVSLPEKGKDEISRLCRNFNSFMENLRSRHSAMTDVAETQVQSGESLNQVSQEYSSAVTQFNRSLLTVNSHTEDIAEKVESSAGEVSRIAGILDFLEQMSREQDERVGTMVKKGQKVFESLSFQESAIQQQVRLTGQVREEGLKNQQILELLKKQIGDILKQSVQISEAIQSIQDLADQTDVLAINASIEAAHAGIYGKGFAVVSNEMRNLSDQVRENTALVNIRLKELNEKLSLMADEEKENRESVHKLITQNKDAEEVIQNLETSMEGIQSVVGGFFMVLEEVRTGSSRVHEETERVRTSGYRINRLMEELKVKQKELILEWDEMNQGVEMLSRGTESLNDLSARNHQSAATLNQEIRLLGS